MVRLIMQLVLYLGLAPTQASGQQLQPNRCDSSALTKQELKHCQADSIYSTDIILKINYLSSLKTELLPKYRSQRNKLELGDGLKSLVTLLRHIYDSTLNHKMNVWEEEMDKNQKHVQPKVYISSLLSFQEFKFYPDVFAILLNDIHLELKPKTTLMQTGSIKKLIDEIIEQIATKVHQQLKKTTNEFVIERGNLTKAFNIVRLFQGDTADKSKARYELINFLIWLD